jgi:hypothetical protein
MSVPSKQVLRPSTETRQDVAAPTGRHARGGALEFRQSTVSVEKPSKALPLAAFWILLYPNPDFHLRPASKMTS